jgi:hypothetical protein
MKSSEHGVVVGESEGRGLHDRLDHGSGTPDATTVHGTGP